MPVKGKKFGLKRQEMANRAELLCKNKRCHFSKQEVERLLQMYKEIVSTQTNELKVRVRNGIDRNRFRDLLHQNFGITEDHLMDKIFKAFDGDNDGFINEEEWVLGMSVFLKGTLEEQAEFCFGVYCFRGDGYISREEMYQLLKNCLVKITHEEDPDEMPKDLVEIIIKKMDSDHDGRLSLEDYVKAVKEEKLLLEALGRCLPDNNRKTVFLQNIADVKDHVY
ncbi:hypothetical protein ACJMK2_024285 [Sinanodonta woodiana]|uniref:EF-hand domain-containing protein n=1 Tax=Sinanodonta woodiana TaxID=1069815 RepID=A0ABD3T780_SINWO